MTRQRQVLVVFISTWIVSGVAEAVFYDALEQSNSAMVIHTLILAVLLMIWAHFHAVAKQVAISKGTCLFIGLVPILGLPYYLFSRFGFKSGSRKVLLAFLFLVACLFAYFASFELAWWLVT